MLGGVLETVLGKFQKDGRDKTRRDERSTKEELATVVSDMLNEAMNPPTRQDP